MSQNLQYIEQFNISSQSTQTEMICLRKTQKGKNKRPEQLKFVHNLILSKNPLLQINTLNAQQIQKNFKAEFNQNYLSKFNQFQQLRLNLRQWRDRRVPNTNEIISEYYGIRKPEVINFKKNAPQYINRNKKLNDLGNDSSFQMKDQAIKKIKNNQRIVKKLQANQIKTKFRQSTNSHLRKEKKFQQQMWEYAIEQRYFYDNCKYRYENEQIIKRIEQAALDCTKLHQYEIQTIQVLNQPQFSLTKNPNQFQKAINQKVSKLFPRAFNLICNFF